MAVETVKYGLKSLLPEAAIRQVRRLKRRLRQRRDGRRSAAEVFGEVYSNNLWGGRRGEFFSGEGTHFADASAYVALVRRLVREHGLSRVVDIGCGDFQIGRQIVAGDAACDYLGVDVVPDLVARNQRLFGGPRVSFRCLDATRDELPVGDLVLVREVLQHLSNAEIAVILGKLRNYRYALISEYQPAAEHLVRPNIDKAHGMDTRIWDGSAVFPERPPFALKGLEVVLAVPASVPLVAPGECVVSYLMRNERAHRTAA